MEIDNPLRVLLFWTKVIVGGEDDCWPWTGGLDRKGYAQFRVSKKGCNKAHIFSFLLHGGKLNPGDHVDHECNTRSCQNPKHLRPLTNAANNARSSSPSAINARKIRCIRGHELVGRNVYVRPNGWRTCIKCRREKEEERHAARQAA